MTRWLADVAGKLWNSPNTVLGLAYGGLGMGVGAIARLARLQARAPGIRWRDNAFHFTHNPFGGVGAVTLGNTTTWIGDPYDPGDRIWHDGRGRPLLEGGHTYPEHETAHTYQGQHLGPLYLPSNLLGGLAAMLHGETWHGARNWNERGPQADPPRPWTRRARARR
jgi:hypothetical protein